MTAAIDSVGTRPLRHDPNEPARLLKVAARRLRVGDRLVGKCALEIL